MSVQANLTGEYTKTRGRPSVSAYDDLPRCKWCNHPHTASNPLRLDEWDRLGPLAPICQDGDACAARVRHAASPTEPRGRCARCGRLFRDGTYRVSWTDGQPRHADTLICETVERMRARAAALRAVA